MRITLILHFLQAALPAVCSLSLLAEQGRLLHDGQLELLLLRKVRLCPNKMCMHAFLEHRHA